MKRILLLLTLLLSSGATLSAQEIRFAAEADSTRYLIGEWMTLHLRVDAPSDWRLILPADDDAFENADFVSAADVETTESGNMKTYVQDVVVTVFDTGTVPVSAVLQYRRPGDTTLYRIASDPIDFTVGTVELDTTITFKDIRDVLHVSLTIWDYLLYAGIAILLALLLWFGYRWYRGREDAVEDVVPEEPALPAHVIATRALEQLRSESLWQQAKHKEYQSRVTDILRTYVERRFAVPAMEHPTSEIMPAVAMLGLDTELVGGLEQVLRVADNCKFARYIPVASEHTQSMDFALQFVDKTRPADRPTPTQTAAAPPQADTPQADTPQADTPRGDESRDGDSGEARRSGDV